MSGFLVRGFLGGRDSMLGKATLGDRGRDLIDTALNTLNGTSGSIMRPLFSTVFRYASEANGIVDFQDGSLKDGATMMIKDSLKKLGNVLSDVTTIPMIDGIFAGKKPPGETYLSYELVLKLSGNRGLNEIEKSLYGVSTAFGHYRSESLNFIKHFSEIVIEYLKLFDVFIREKRFIFFSVSSPSYAKLLDTRKKMKDCLNRMKRCLDSYIDNEYTYDNISKGLKNIQLGLREGIDKERAEHELSLMTFWESCRMESDYKDTIIGFQVLGGKTVYDALINDAGFKEEIAKQLSHAMRLTANKDRKSWDWDKIVEISKTAFENLEKNSSLMAFIQSTFGWIQCKTLARNALKDYIDKTSVTVNNMSISKPLLGDYALELRECVTYTLSKLDEVINLGAKQKNYDAIKKSGGLKGVDLNLECLLGSTYGGLDQKKLIDRKIKLNEKLRLETVEKALDWYTQAEKVYKQIQIAYGKSGMPQDLSVKLPSTNEDYKGSGEKDFKIKDRWEDLGKLRKDIQRNAEDKDLPLLLQRKSYKFIKAFEQWKKDFDLKNKEDKRKENANKFVAKSLIQDAKKHYKEFMKQHEVTRKQDEAIKKQNKEMQQKAKEAYNKIPNSVSKFVQDLNKHRDNVELFCADRFEDIKVQ